MKDRKEMQDLKKKAKDLESMLFSVNEEGIDALASPDTLPKLKAIAPLDYDDVKNIADRKASDIVESVVLLYLKEDFIRDQDYVYQKMEVDKLTISNLLFQMRTAEHAIKKLLEEIDGGSLRDRTFEVLSSLQRSKMEIVKHLASFMVTMENNYKNLAYDWEAKSAKQLENNTPTEPALENNIEQDNAAVSKFRGTKGLMSLVQNYMEDAKNKINGSYEDVTDK